MRWRGRGWAGTRGFLPDFVGRVPAAAASRRASAALDGRGGGVHVDVGGDGRFHLVAQQLQDVDGLEQRFDQLGVTGATPLRTSSRRVSMACVSAAMRVWPIVAELPLIVCAARKISCSSS